MSTINELTEAYAQREAKAAETLANVAWALAVGLHDHPGFKRISADGATLLLTSHREEQFTVTVAAL